MKTLLTTSLALMLFSVNLLSQTTETCIVDGLLKNYSVRSYSTMPVTDQQLDLILRCGIKSPSSRNGQPWKFTVVKDTALMRRLIANITPGNLLIIISGIESQQPGVDADFDCGLATQNMFIAASGLGLGARIYGGPIANVISNRDLFQIPAGYKPVIILRIGNLDKTVDAVSAASPRKKFEEVVNFK